MRNTNKTTAHRNLDTTHGRHSNIASKSVAIASSASKMNQGGGSSTKRQHPQGGAGASDVDAANDAQGAAQSSIERPKPLNSSLLNYKPKVGVSAIMKTQNTQIFETYQTVNDSK